MGLAFAEQDFSPVERQEELYQPKIALSLEMSALLLACFWARLWSRKRG